MSLHVLQREVVAQKESLPKSKAQLKEQNSVQILNPDTEAAHTKFCISQCRCSEKRQHRKKVCLYQRVNSKNKILPKQNTQLKAVKDSDQFTIQHGTFVHSFICIHNSFTLWVLFPVLFGGTEICEPCIYHDTRN